MNTIDLDGGKGIVERILKAYGFATQKQFTEAKNVAAGTVSTWIKREFFPGDYAVICALETGVSLKWLATGEGEMYESVPTSLKPDSTLTQLKRIKLQAGKIINAGDCYFDKTLIPDSVIEPVIFTDTETHLIDTGTKSLYNDSKWLIDIDGDISIYEAVKIPNQFLLKNKKTEFPCPENANVIGRVVTTFITN